MTKSNKEFTQAFTKAYKKVATTAIYSMQIANEVGYGNGIKAVDMPKEMAAGVEKHGGGCCFHHAWRLIHELNKVGITAYWAEVPEPSEVCPKDKKCVVVYQIPDKSRHVADIVEDIKAGVKMDDFISEDSCKWINSSGEIIDNSMIDLEQMVLISDNPIVPGYLRIYPELVGDKDFFTFYGEADCELIELADVQEYKNSLIPERCQQLMKVMHVIGDENRGHNISFSISHGYSGQPELFLTGNVEGRSLKLPTSTNWKFSKKNGGMIVGPLYPVHYEKDRRYS